MKKLLLLSAFFLIGMYGFAQTENEESDASEHGKAISDLSKNAVETGKEKGALISSAARSKGVLHANANARFIRGDAKPTAAAAGKPEVMPTVNGKPETLPPVTVTTGKPASTPVGKPVGVPVGQKPIELPSGH